MKSHSTSAASSSKPRARNNKQAESSTARTVSHIDMSKARKALVLQGGGALGSYQAGVYDALSQHQVHPQWVAGVSIGAINAALIAGNAPEKRVERLDDFWRLVSSAPAQRLRATRQWRSYPP